jgi:hypothetical protein
MALFRFFNQGVPMSKPLPPEKKLEWEEKVRQQLESGLSIAKWCSQNQIVVHTFYYWKERLFPKNQLTRSCFTELPVSQGTGISIEYRGVRILIDKYFDPATLKSCLSALKGVSC